MGVTVTDKLFLTKHLATLIKSGVPLDDSLETVKDQATQICKSSSKNN
jgi:type II secretory pathway component PulF